MEFQESNVEPPLKAIFFLVLKAVTNAKLSNAPSPTVELEAIGNKSFDDCFRQLNKDFICFHR